MRVLARDEGMGNGGIRDRLDFLDLEDSKVGEPAVEAKQRVVMIWSPKNGRHEVC